MSVIIKGMKLPLPGDVMVCALIDGKLQCSIVTRGKPIEWREVLEVPTPHGRLIDADEVLDDFMLAYPVYSPELGCAFEIIENADEFFKAEVSE